MRAFFGISLLVAGALCMSLMFGVFARGQVELGVLLIALAVACTIAAGKAFGGEEDAIAHDPFWGGEGRRWSMSEEEFEALVKEVESVPAAAEPLADDDFQRALADAIDELPDWVRDELKANVSILVADDGFHPDRYGHADSPYLYGLYHPSETAASWQSGARIIIFRDSLLRDFPDPDELRQQIVTTLRHEVAHHFGADERRVEELGL